MCTAYRYSCQTFNLVFNRAEGDGGDEYRQKTQTFKVLIYPVYPCFTVLCFFPPIPCIPVKSAFVLYSTVGRSSLARLRCSELRSSDSTSLRIKLRLASVPGSRYLNGSYPMLVIASPVATCGRGNPGVNCFYPARSGTPWVLGHGFRVVVPCYVDT